MGRGRLTPESAANQKKLIAETRAKNKAIQAEAMKIAEKQKLNAAIKETLKKRSTPKVSRATSRATGTRSISRGGSIGGRGSGGGLFNNQNR